MIEAQTCEFPNTLKKQGLRHFDVARKADLSLLWMGSDKTVHTNAAPSVIGSADRRNATNWRASLPVLQAKGVTLRELRLSDAPSLLAFLTTDEVTRFISPPPTTIAGFERFIEWTHRERAAGHYVCFGIVPEGYDQAVGLFQVRQLNASFQTAEWGFAMGSNFWGTGVFIESARAVAACAAVGVVWLSGPAARPRSIGPGPITGHLSRRSARSARRRSRSGAGRRR